MTTPVVPVTGYANVADYELRIGVNVPANEEPMVQIRLNDSSAMVKLYLGQCADEVEASYRDILTSLVCQQVQQSFTITPGVRSETVGSTSVSYLDPTGQKINGLSPDAADVLDALMAACCPDFSAGGSKVGQVGVAWGGEGKSWAADVDVWVMSR